MDRAEAEKFARAAVEAIWKKYPGRPAGRYPVLLLYGEQVHTFVSLRGAPPLGDLFLQFPNLGQGSTYMGPLDVCPDRVAVITWAPDPKALTFDPVTGEFAEDAGLARQASPPNWG